MITLNGPSAMTVDAQRSKSFTDPGATAIDACAGSVAVTSGGTVDVNTPGSYTLTYHATDGANAATPVTRTVAVVPVADLSVTCNTPPSTVVTGSDLTYMIEVRNAGPQSAEGVVLTNPLPTGTSFVSATGNYSASKGKTSTVTWNLGTLAPLQPGQQPLTFTLVVKVSAKAGAIISNTATVSSGGPQDPNPGNNSATVSTTVKAKR